MSKRLTAAMECLADTLQRENAALAALDLRGAGGLLQEKSSAAKALVEAQAGGGAAVPACPAALARRLLELSRENRRLLENAMRVQGRVIGIVAGAARPVGAPCAYGATGRAGSSRPPPCALSARA